MDTFGFLLVFSKENRSKGSVRGIYLAGRETEQTSRLEVQSWRSKGP